MVKSPPITLLMPIRNGEKFLSEAMKVLEENTSSEDEILLVNDNSLDETGSILKKWAKRNSNVTVLNNPKSGLVSALNFGLNKASHEWIARFDVDDRYPSSRITETKKFIKNDVVAIFTDYQFTTDSGIGLGVIPSAIEPNSTFLSLVSSQRTAHPSVCFNKYAVQESGGYIQEDFPAEDLSLWLRLSLKGSILSIPKNLLFYRLSKHSISSKLRQDAIQSKKKLLDKFVFNNQVIEECISNLDATKSFYDNYKLGNYRYLLHLRDLNLISESSNNYNLANSMVLRKKIYGEISHYAQASKLLTETLLRKLYRTL
jgi:glycosyltransferase involved in cell wall biosynthesis